MISNHKYFHWYYFNEGKEHYYNIGSGLFIWLFLSITQPFGIYDNNVSNYWLLVLFLLPFGSVFTFVSYFIDFLFIRLLGIKIKKKFNLDFRVWLFKLLLLIHALFYFRNFLCDGRCMDFSEYLQLWLACILLFSFTYFPFMLYAKYLYFHKMVGTSEGNKDFFELVGEGKEKLFLEDEKLIYFKSDDNYVEVYFLNETGKLEKTLFRATLKSIENQITQKHQFIRTHRSYIVNIRYAYPAKTKDVLEIKTEHESFQLPISKKYQSTIANLFIHPK